MKAEKTEITRLLKTAKGQIEGVTKMVEEDQYCINISNQISATIAILKKINMEILDAHLSHCVRSAEKEELDQKLDEVKQVLHKMMK